MGKSTVTLTLGQALADLGCKVLLVDLDPQSSLTMTLKIDAENTSIFEVIGSTEPGRLSPQSYVLGPLVISGLYRLILP